MPEIRKEHDLLGKRDIPADALHGIHTLRAIENFPLSGRHVNPALIHAYGVVKLACARTNHELGRWDAASADAIFNACAEMGEGLLDSHIIVDALQGGAGTSTNMNVNEVIANRALQLLERQPGEYDVIDPLDDINLHQSTNDTYPTALKVAAITLLRELEQEIVALHEAFQAKEKEFADIVKVGRTQYQDAVLTTLGREMGAYADAFSRDRWRVYKCEERLRVVNLGGTAIGTGISAPRKYIFKAVELLRAITGFGFARGENLIDATQNADVYVEVSGILKALAVNLLKISGDLRFMSSGPNAGIGEIRLPAMQAGSTVMPGKVNPVIPEAVSQAAMAVIANDSAITQAVSMGHMELNAFIPLIADALLGSLDLLAAACRIFREKCVVGIEADEARCRAHIETSTATLTALVNAIGYQTAKDIAVEMRDTGTTARELVTGKKLMTEAAFDEAISPEAVTRLGTPDGEGL